MQVEPLRLTVAHVGRVNDIGYPHSGLDLTSDKGQDKRRKQYSPTLAKIKPKHCKGGVLCDQQVYCYNVLFYFE